MIAQAILESDSSKSTLSANDNNLFGVKGLYQNLYGQKYLTWEDDGTPAGYYVYSNFRKYPSFKESMEDYASLLRNGLDLDRNFYYRMWKENSTMEEAIDSLSGSYATDRFYGEKIKFIIKEYRLDTIEDEMNKEKMQIQEKIDYQKAKENQINLEKQEKLKELQEKMKKSEI